MSNFIELGIHPSLSLAELRAASKEPMLVGELLEGKILLTDQFGSDDLSGLSGLIRFGNIIVDSVAAPFDENLVNLLLEYCEKNAIRQFGISILGDIGKIGNAMSLRRHVGLNVKRAIKESGKSIRYADSKEADHNAVSVRTNRLLREDGREFILIPFQGGWKLGITRSIQDVFAWSKRDFGRPRRDAKRGMLPPKLARLMVNLSRAAKTDLLWDPFCGSGTILMEAALLGFTNVIGSDIDERAVSDSDINLDWLAEEFGTTDKPSLFVGDALDAVPPAYPDAIVAEVHLGKPKKGTETRLTLTSELDLLARQYEGILINLAEQLKKGGRVVIAFPVFRLKEETFSLPIDRLAKKAGLQIKNPLSGVSVGGFDPKLTQNGGLLYARSNQFVGREIVVMEK